MRRRRLRRLRGEPRVERGPPERGLVLTGEGKAPVRHWFLTGWSGSGKTLVGARLAALAGRPFLDLDAAVERSEGRAVAAILGEDGEEAFREAEAAALAGWTESAAPSVIALGGGTLEGERARLLVERTGLLVWLDAPLATCLERLQRPGEPPRPLVEEAMGRGPDALAAFHAARRMRYQGARVRVPAEATPDALAREILRRLDELEAG